MNLEQLKKTLAKLGIAGLVAGSALTFTGCSNQKGNSSGSDKAEIPANSS